MKQRGIYKNTKTEKYYDRKIILCMTASVNLPIPLRQRYSLRGVGGFTEAFIHRERETEKYRARNTEKAFRYMHMCLYTSMCIYRLPQSKE